MLRRAFFASLVAITFAACSSVPELRFDGDPGGEGGTETGTDAGVDTAPPCVKTGNVEICDDDLDNDCNGMKDCADPACGGGFACAAPAPDGWQLVAFVETAPPACPTGFTNPTELRVLNGVTTHTCPCTCSGAGGGTTTCAGAPTIVTMSTEATCAGATTKTVASNAVACTAMPGGALPVPGGADTPFAMMGTPATPVSCAPTASITKTDPTSGRTCVPPAKSGTGCTGTMRCLPKPTGYSMCIAKDGDQVCPTGFAKRRRAGTTSNDTRVCQGCTCGAPTPCVGEVTLWSNNACSLKSWKLTSAANTVCSPPPVGADDNFQAAFYKSTITGGCAVATPGVAQGELTFGGERTICCR